MKRTIKKARHLLGAAVMLLLVLAGNMTAYAADAPTIEYTLYNTNGEKKTGKDWTAAGDTSQSRSEKKDYWNAISMKITSNTTGYSGGVQYAIHVHDVGWSHLKKNGGEWYENGQKLYYDTVNGFTTKYPWIEAVSAKLTGDLKNYYYINYNTRISPLSQTFRDSPDVAVDENRYQRGLKFFNGDAKKTSYWVGFDEDLSKVLGDGYNEEGLANDGGLNFAGTWGMTMPISAFRAQLLPYQVKVTINPNGGAYSGSTDATISWPQADTIKSIATPKRTGYKFTGWIMTQTSIKDSKESLKKNKQQYPDNDRVATWKTKNTELQLGNKNVTLKAKWEKNSYTLTVKPNGGTWNSKTTDQSFTMKYAATKTIADPTQPGYTFAGWTLSGTGSKLSGKTFTMGTANAILTAKWTANTYQLTVKPNGGIWNSKTTDQSFAMKYAATKTIANPTRPGYTFAGWTLSGAGSKLSGKTFTMGSANAVLTAKWTVNTYQLTVKPNGGTWEGKTDNQNFTMKYAATITIVDPTRTGYTFTGWTVSGTGSSLSGRTFTMGSADAILMANWKANSYTIVFDGNGATGGAMGEMQAFYDQDVQLPANLFVKETEQGISAFTGWNRVPDTFEKEFADGEIIRNLTVENGAVIVLYAIWDDCPIIEASDRYFNRWWAQNGKITEEELLRTASAVDKEDNELENRTKAQIEESGLPGSLSLLDYNPEAFTSMTEDGTVNLTYRAVDSAGNTVYETVQVHVYSTAAIPLPEKYTRYINRKYYEKSYEEGGLHPDSIFRTDPEHKQALEEALDNIDNDTPVASYYFTHEEVEEAQDYVTEHGIGNTKEPDALQRFFDYFMR